MYQRNEPTLESNGRDLAEQLQEAVARLPAMVFQARQLQTVSDRERQTYPAPKKSNPTPIASFRTNICVREGDTVRPLRDLNNQTRQRIRGLIRVRDAVRRCLRSQLEGHDETEVLWPPARN